MISQSAKNRNQVKLKVGQTSLMTVCAACNFRKVSNVCFLVIKCDCP